MTREEAERMLTEWYDVTHDRDNRIAPLSPQA